MHERTDTDMRMPDGSDVDLDHHGDAELAPGLVDLAVNVRTGAPPRWLRDQLEVSLGELGAYPDSRVARNAVACHHTRPHEEVLLTAGAAEAFVLVARAFAPSRAVVVHPQFTEPERALRDAGHRVERVVLQYPFWLDPAQVPQDADLVVLGNPTNPTSVLHCRDTVASLARPGRVLVVDEAFMDAVPGEPTSLASERDLPGVLVVRSLTKTWGLAGLRVGYVLAAPALVGRLESCQPKWPLSSPALAAVEACLSRRGLDEIAAWQPVLSRERDRLVRLLRELPAVVVPDPQAPFVLFQVPNGAAARAALRERGFAVRRGDTFPGLGPDWLRVAVRDGETTMLFVRSLADALAFVDV